VINAFVRVMRFMPTGGERRRQQVGGDNTDDRGIYRVHSLQPGDYAVCASYRGNGPQNDAERIQQQIDGLRRSLANAPTPAARQQMSAQLADLQAQLPAQTEPMTGYGVACFPGSSPTTSTTIVLATGEEKGGIDLQLQPTHVARVEGMLVVPPGHELRSVQMMLVNAEDPGLATDRNFGDRDERGRFVFTSVPSGHYTIMARSLPGWTVPRMPGTSAAQDPPAAGLWANADIVVAGQDINGVVLEMQRGTSISGQVTFQGSSPPPDPIRATVTVFPAAPETNPPFGAGNSQAVVDASGRFTVSDVFPGSYRISAGLMGGTQTPWIVQTITVDGEDALDTPLEIKGRGSIENVVITLTDRLTELSGLIIDDKGKPAIEQTVLLFPADSKYWVYQSRRTRTTRAGEDGRYVFRAVPPGEYRLATLIDPEPGSWFDKALLADLDATSVRISLSEGEKRVENMRVK
jgi:hypothetical protein